MYRIILVLCICLVLSCKDKKRFHDDSTSNFENVKSNKLADILSFQKGLNAEFKNPETSPLPDRYRKNFESLEFFKPDTNFVITANLIRTPNAIPFSMPTTTERQSTEVVFGVAKFNLNGETFELEIYQSPELIKDEGFEDYLFLPFTDNTNGKETYGGGRYLDLRIPKGDTIILDFNKAYNPYCVYNKKYSCPLVPRQNNLNTYVTAGVKRFDKK